MKKLISILLITCMSASLSGCIGMQIDPDITRQFAKGISNSVNNSVDNNIRSEEVFTHNLGSDNTVLNLKVNSSVGDITIKQSDIKEPLINVRMEARAATKERAEQIIKEFTYTVEIANGDTINIDTKRFGNKYDAGFEGITVDLDIKVPISIIDFNIISNVGDIASENANGHIKYRSDVGNIDIKNSVASYDLHSNVGDITLNECENLGASEIISSVGDIDMYTKNISGADKINLRADVGNITMSLPPNSNYTADISEFMKDKKNTFSGDGKTQIILKTNTGDINFEENSGSNI